MGSRAGDIAVLTLEAPPVNAFSLGLRQALHRALAFAQTDPAVRAVVLMGGGTGFSAGGDTREFGTSAVLSFPRLTVDVQPLIAQLGKPVVAALHGYAVGGGLETALCCHARVATADTKIAQPEVGHGLLPPTGTQCLPRLIGMEAAIELIMWPHAQRRAAHYRDTALFDRVLPPGSGASLREAAVDIAHALLAKGVPYPSVDDCVVPAAASHAALAAARDRLALEGGGTEAQRLALRALEAACSNMSFEAGMRESGRLVERLLSLRGRLHAP
jgi:enoyl-CoA hydratase